MRLRTRLALVASIAFAAGCGGNRGTLLPTQLAGNAHAAGTSDVQATVQIDVPKTAQNAASFVAANTKGVAISVYRHGHDRGKPAVRVTASLAAGSRNCKSSAGGRVCSIVVNLSAARYDFVVEAYDKAPKHGQIPTSARELGAGVTVAKVSAHGANLVKAVLGGVVARLLFHLNVTASSAIDPLNQTAIVEALDADGTPIVTGTYADAKGKPVSISMHADAAAGTTISFQPASFSTPQTGGVRVKYFPYNLTSVQAANGFVSSLSATASNGAEPGSVAFTAAQPQIVEVTLPVANSGPNFIAPGPDGALWFTENSASKIGRITTAMTSTSLTEFPTPTSGSGPAYIVAGPNSALWFTESFVGNIARSTVGGDIVEFPTSPLGSFPFGIAFGPDGNMWATEYNSNAIVKVTPSGTMTPYTIPTSNSGPLSIALGPDGAMWFAECQKNNIGRITTNGLFVTYSIPTPLSKPSDIVAGSDGALWFTESGAHQIGRLATNGSFKEYPVAGQPEQLVSGPDGAIWFAESMVGKIGRLGAGGTIINEYPLSSGAATDLQGMTVGPDGGVYFVEYESNKVGRIR